MVRHSSHDGFIEGDHYPGRYQEIKSSYLHKANSILSKSALRHESTGQYGYRCQHRLHKDYIRQSERSTEVWSK